MPVKSWSVGDVLTAADMDAWAVPLAAIKSADTARSNTTIANDPDLQVTVAASAQYDIRACIRYKGGTNGSSDAQFQINVPASSSGFWMIQRINISGLAVGFADANFGSPLNAGTNGTGNTMQAILSGSITTTNTGTVAVAWAQNISNGTATTVMANSTLVLQRIG